ncbi:MAG: putative glycoside hydrolase [Alphaproteobacteria bacterium]
MPRPIRTSRPAALPALALAAFVAIACASGAGATDPRWPATRTGIMPFSDQFGQVTDAQLRFAATHFAGVQKMTASQTAVLKAANPAFIVLNYRLGNGIGIDTLIVEGDRWVPEYPGDAALQEQWFWHDPATGRRVVNTDWGWYLMNVGDAGWRAWYHDTVLAQLRMNGNDGVFLDSINVPNFLGAAEAWEPDLPAYDPPFEAMWTEMIRGHIAYLAGHELGRYLLVPNVGGWINGREDMSYFDEADGVWVEGFALWGDDAPLPEGDWQLQLNRVLRATRNGQAVITQSYVDGDRARTFATGSFLLAKGDHSYIILQGGAAMDWPAQYEIPIGAPVDRPAGDIRTYDPDGDGVYVRQFDNATVYVNARGPDDGGRRVSIQTAGWLALAEGSGRVEVDGSEASAVGYRQVDRIELDPISAAIVFRARP